MPNLLWFAIISVSSSLAISSSIVLEGCSGLPLRHSLWFLIVAKSGQKPRCPPYKLEHLLEQPLAWEFRRRRHFCQEVADNYTFFEEWTRRPRSNPIDKCLNLTPAVLASVLRNDINWSVFVNPLSNEWWYVISFFLIIWMWGNYYLSSWLGFPKKQKATIRGIWRYLIGLIRKIPWNNNNSYPIPNFHWFHYQNIN